LPSVRAILFDLGETLVRFEPLDRQRLFEQAARRTYRFWARRQDRMPGYRRYYLHQWFAMHWGRAKLLLGGREPSAEHYLRRACRKLWLNGDEQVFRQVLWQWYQPLADVARLEPDALAVLRDLQGRGYRLGLVSNTFIPGFVHDQHLERLGLLELLPHRTYSSEVGYRKPHRRIFELATQRMNVAPTEAMFVGDRWREDVRGARGAGLVPVWKCARSGQATSGRRNRDAARIEALAELPHLVASGAQPPAEAVVPQC
jgi:HAD superfamily hydrolase (TIGR01549 family)